MAAPRTEKCSLCGSAAHLVAESAPGYQEGRNYTIYECEGCLSSFASPLASDDSIYGRIYKNIQSVPGYNRYYRYAHEVLKQKKALDYLSRQEESYWAVARHLRKRRSIEEQAKYPGGRMRVGIFCLRIGEGRIYMSPEWIFPRKQSPGHLGTMVPTMPHKTLKDLKAQGHHYDLIIMNQLIEHLPDVHAFFSEALDLLSPSGELILTIPNKSAYPNADWDSDLPPVHLWWFGEDAMRYLARHYGCDIRFVDFQPFYKSFLRIKPPNTPIMSRRSVFDVQGAPLDPQYLPPVNRLRRILEGTKVMSLLSRVRVVVKNKDRWDGPRGQICAAVMRRTR